MARTKYGSCFCSFCNKTTRMELLGGVQAGTEKIWCRCTRCHHMTMLEVKSQESGNGNGKIDMNAATPYTPEQSFQVGDAIFHSGWNDFGKVLNKVRTSDGSFAIVVSFEKGGQRTLIENLKTPIANNT